ncbi:MAG: DegT/DnrJ/EryC1/StrS family aminotransferase [Planctomycetia bacterium]|nr:DegT/DnrJ/EryC1/StrS family aminotransferase [Planctomycetia bacterium]MCC7314284.1 DegT/DnrJ/EryC1/StrS family aminotransferase [Planctomycetota bacterium]
MPHRESKPDADFPISERMADRCISLPMFPEMTDEEVEFVISDTRQVLMTGGRQS